MGNFVKAPTVSGDPGGDMVAEPSDVAMVQLLGGISWGSVVVTSDQARGVYRWLDMNPDAEDDSLARAGAIRNAHRHAECHGLRMLLFLAGNRLLETGEDPVRFLAGVLADAGYDVSSWDDDGEGYEDDE